MSEVMVTMMAALAAELLLVLLVLLLVAWFRNRAARRRDHKATRVLVARVKNSRNEREAAIASYLVERMGMSGEPLEQAKAAILRAEMVLLQRFANVYRKRDAGAAAQFDIDLAAAVGPYHELHVEGIEVTADEPAADASEFEQLRAENERLSEELRVTMETMSRMLNEYSSMFAGGAEGMTAPIAAMAGAAGTAATAAEEITASESQAEPAEPLSEAGPEDGADVDILADDVDAVAAADETVAETDGLDNIDDIADLSAEIDSEVEYKAAAEDLIDADTDFTEQEDIDALLVAENDDSPLDESGQDAAAASAEEEPAEVADVLDEIFGDASAEFAPEEEAMVEAIQEPPKEVDRQDDPEATGNQDEVALGTDEELPAIEIEAGDDLETVTELLEEEGVAEVVAFDEPGDLAGPGDFDVALAVDGDQLFDPTEPEVTALAEELEGDLVDTGGIEDAPDVDGLFDAVDEPLKTGAGQ